MPPLLSPALWCPGTTHAHARAESNPTPVSPVSWILLTPLVPALDFVGTQTGVPRQAKELLLHRGPSGERCRACPRRSSGGIPRSPPCTFSRVGRPACWARPLTRDQEPFGLCWPSGNQHRQQVRCHPTPAVFRGLASLTDVFSNVCNFPAVCRPSDRCRTPTSAGSRRSARCAG